MTGRPRIGFGGDYNPEQWDPSVWAEDVALMQEAGVNLVSVGIFSWALLEPTEGVYEFGWLDEVLDLLHGAGIRVDLANASASPPPWFSHRYPESLPVTVSGVRLGYGSRQAFCASSPDYRRAAAALTTKIVERYASHPAVVMWHVHNEYGCHNQPCYCDVSGRAFQGWLERKYVTIDALNDGVGHGLLVAALLELPRGHAAPAVDGQRQHLPGARLLAVLLRRAARVLPSRGRDHPSRILASGHDELHGLLDGPAPADRLLEVVGGDGHRLQRPLPDRRRSARLPGAGDDRRLHARPRGRRARGC